MNEVIFKRPYGMSNVLEERHYEYFQPTTEDFFISLSLGMMLKELRRELLL